MIGPCMTYMCDMVYVWPVCMMWSMCGDVGDVVHVWALDVL